MKDASRNSHGRGSHPRALLLVSASALSLLGGAAHAQDGEMRILSLNTWHDRFHPEPAARMSDFVTNGNYDLLTFQENRPDSTYLTDIPDLLRARGLGQYSTGQIGDLGVASRLAGDHGTYDDGVEISHIDLEAQDGRPRTTVGTVHLNYYDPATIRIDEAKALNEWADGQSRPAVITGDFNAGDVAERGLLSVDQQKLILQDYVQTEDAFYGRLLGEYARDEDQLRTFVAENAGQSVSTADIPDDLFAPETYPVLSNTPQTMNILKKDYILLQNGSEREDWTPHDLRDGSTTWPSAAEDEENRWPSWDRTKIDHFLVTRGTGKWYALSDGPSDPYLGVLDETGFADDGTPLSDHEAVAHNLRWTGPSLEEMGAAGDDELRLVWNEDAAAFAETGGTFELTRNNMRTDLYLGQIAGENGMPRLDGLIEAERKMQLDCGGGDPRFSAAVAEYCLDDHGFIGETLVEGGTLAVDEDAALGGPEADLRLADAALRVEGADVDVLDREISLESGGGVIDLVAINADVTATGPIRGEGGLTKQGQGTLRLAAVNSFTGRTRVEEGTLAVDGAIARSGRTEVLADGVLAGTGTVGNVANSGTIAPAGDGIGTLTLAGDLRLDGGSLAFQAGISGADHLAVLGDLGAASPFAIDFDLFDSFMPQNDAWEFLTVAGSVESSFLEMASIDLPQGDAFTDWSVFMSGGRFALAESDPFAPAAVPVPASLPVLLSALGLLGLVRGRGRSRGQQAA